MTPVVKALLRFAGALRCPVLVEHRADDAREVPTWMRATPTAERYLHLGRASVDLQWREGEVLRSDPVTAGDESRMAAWLNHHADAALVLDRLRNPAAYVR